MMTKTQHPLDPMTADERAEADALALTQFPNGETVWMETTYCGGWCGTYRIGDYNGSGRYKYVGKATGENA